MRAELRHEDMQSTPKYAKQASHDSALLECMQGSMIFTAKLNLCGYRLKVAATATAAWLLHGK